VGAADELRGARVDRPPAALSSAATLPLLADLASSRPAPTVVFGVDAAAGGF
jgi:hypothetical protein